MRHPFSSIEPPLLGALLLRLGVLLVFSTALIAFLNVPLETEAAPLGIVSFELAGTPYTALAILLEWQSKSVVGHATLLQLVDFLYLLIYGAFFSMLALWVGRRLGDSTWSLRAAWAATLAAGFDILENGVLLFELVRMSSPAPYPQLAMAFALLKFVLIGFAAVYGLGGLVKSFGRR